MSRYKMFAFIVLMTFAFGIALVADALAGERGKAAGHNLGLMTTTHALKVPDVEDHNIFLYGGKGIAFTDKWGNGKATDIGMLDVIKGASSSQGYTCLTFPDGSIYTITFKGNATAASNTGTFTWISGTGKPEGIQGGGTWKAYMLAPDQWYTD
jgi:hypothetical protein